MPLEELPASCGRSSIRLRKREKEIAKLKVWQLRLGRRRSSASASPLRRLRRCVEDVGGVKVLARRVPSLPTNELRNLADTFRGKLKSGVVLLGTEVEGKVTLLAAVTADVVGRVSADDLAQAMAPLVGGKGGGKPDLAQAGGKDAAEDRAGPRGRGGPGPREAGRAGLT